MRQPGGEVQGFPPRPGTEVRLCHALTVQCATTITKNLHGHSHRVLSSAPFPDS